MDINEEQNFLNKATFNREETLYKSFGKQYGLLSILTHSTPSQSELIQVFFISYDVCKCSFCSLKAIDAIVFKRIIIATDLDHD